MKVILGIAGGIAAYKSAILLRLLKEAGHDVVPIPTANALRFVGAPTWEALSGHSVTAEVFDDIPSVNHVRLGKSADLVIVAPATADLLSRAATGRADDLLTSTLLTATCPVVFAPTMHTEMWNHAATVANVETLRSRGNYVIEPSSGRLTGVDTGPGRLPEPEEIATLALAFLQGPLPDLSGRTVVVNAGGTREALDPVRFIGNHSSGMQGVAIAAAAAAAGAHVRLICAHIQVPTPAGMDVIHVGTTDELLEATVKAAQDADIVITAAAPADFKAAMVSEEKIKRGDSKELTLSLVPNPDIAASIGLTQTPRQQLVIFAAETHNGFANAQKKLRSKNADLVVYNNVADGKVFGAQDNTVTIADANGVIVDNHNGTKSHIAHLLIAEVASRLT